MYTSIHLYMYTCIHVYMNTYNSCSTCDQTRAVHAQCATHACEQQAWGLSGRQDVGHSGQKEPGQTFLQTCGSSSVPAGKTHIQSLFVLLFFPIFSEKTQIFFIFKFEFQLFFIQVWCPHSRDFRFEHCLRGRLRGRSSWQHITYVHTEQRSHADIFFFQREE